MSFKRLILPLLLIGLSAFLAIDGRGFPQFDAVLADIKARAGLATGVAPANTPARAAPAYVVGPGALYVYDGDTIIIDDQRMRILDIDTPEISEPRCQAEEKAGIEAQNRLRSMVARARKVEIADTGQRDKYGRPLIHLFIDGTDAGRILVYQGLAVVWKPGAQAWSDRRRHWCGF